MTRPGAATRPDPVPGNRSGRLGAPPRRVDVETTSGPARVVIEEPGGMPSFLLALTHGAGGDVDAPDLLAVRDAALRLGGVVARVTQPYRVRRARAPGSAVRQDAAWVEIITAIRGGPPSGPGGLPLVQGGRSNGARVACRTAAAVDARAVIALAFPLRPPGHPDRSRAAELRVPGRKLLVVNGDRDPFGVPGRRPGARVVVLAGESHALSRRPAAAGRAVAAWLPRVLGLPPVPGPLPARAPRPVRLPRRPGARKNARPAGDENTVERARRWRGRRLCGRRGRRGGRVTAARGVRLQGHVGGAMRSDGVAVGKQFPGVVKDNDAVTEQAPTLLWVANYRPGRLAVRSRRFRTGWRVRAHLRASWIISWLWSRSESSAPDDQQARYTAL